jgi:hypothetical protein
VSVTNDVADDRRIKRSTEQMICIAKSAVARVVLVWLVAAITALSPMRSGAGTVEDDSRTKRCIDALTRVGSDRSDSRDTANDTALNSGAAARLQQLRAQLRGRATGGVVVYTFVTEPAGVAVLRLEALGQNRGVSEEVVVRSTRSADFFRQIVQGASQPDNVYLQRLLKTDFSLAQAQRDQGKRVFVMDTDSFGLVPQSLDPPGSVLFASSSLETAIANLTLLGQAPPPNVRYAAVLGIPRTKAEYIKVFGKVATSQFAPLEEWQSYWKDQQDLVRQHQLTTIKPGGGSDNARKTDFLRQLSEQEGIIMIIAHAEGAEIHVPNGQTIRITAGDIAGLKLRKSAFVFLRVCQGKDVGFAEAFLKAGAAGVWANRGIIRADAANRQAREFLRRVQAGMSVLQSIDEISASDALARSSSVLFTRSATGRSLGGAG